MLSSNSSIPPPDDGNKPFLAKTRYNPSQKVKFDIKAIELEMLKIVRGDEKWSILLTHVTKAIKSALKKAAQEQNGYHSPEVLSHSILQGTLEILNSAFPLTRIKCAMIEAFTGHGALLSKDGEVLIPALKDVAEKTVQSGKVEVGLRLIEIACRQAKDPAELSEWLPGFIAKSMERIAGSESTPSLYLIGNSLHSQSFSPARILIRGHREIVKAAPLYLSKLLEAGVSVDRVITEARVLGAQKSFYSRSVQYALVEGAKDAFKKSADNQDDYPRALKEFKNGLRTLSFIAPGFKDEKLSDKLCSALFILPYSFIDKHENLYGSDLARLSTRKKINYLLPLLCSAVVHLREFQIDSDPLFDEKDIDGLAQLIKRVGVTPDLYFCYARLSRLTGFSEISKSLLTDIIGYRFEALRQSSSGDSGWIPLEQINPKTVRSRYESFIPALAEAFLDSNDADEITSFAEVLFGSDNENLVLPLTKEISSYIKKLKEIREFERTLSTELIDEENKILGRLNAVRMLLERESSVRDSLDLSSLKQAHRWIKNSMETRLPDSLCQQTSFEIIRWLRDPINLRYFGALFPQGLFRLAADLECSLSPSEPSNIDGLEVLFDQKHAFNIISAVFFWGNNSEAVSLFRVFRENLAVYQKNALLYEAQGEMALNLAQFMESSQIVGVSSYLRNAIFLYRSSIPESSHNLSRLQKKCFLRLTAYLTGVTNKIGERGIPEAHLLPNPVKFEENLLDQIVGLCCFAVNNSDINRKQTFNDTWQRVLFTACIFLFNENKDRLRDRFARELCPGIDDGRLWPPGNMYGMIFRPKNARETVNYLGALSGALSMYRLRRASNLLVDLPKYIYPMLEDAKPFLNAIQGRKLIHKRETFLASLYKELAFLHAHFRTPENMKMCAGESLKRRKFLRSEDTEALLRLQGKK